MPVTSWGHLRRRRPDLDALRGWQLRSPHLLEYLPLFAERVTWRACEQRCPRVRWSRAQRAVQLRLEPGGHFRWNVAFTMEAYLLAGGYTTTVELFEDRDLGQRISVMRGARHAGPVHPCHPPPFERMPFEACSNGRRALAALTKNSTDIFTAASPRRQFPPRDPGGALMADGLGYRARAPPWPAPPSGSR